MQMLCSLTDLVAVSLSLTLLIFPHCFLSQTLTLLGLYSVTDSVTSALCPITDTDALGTVFCYRHCYFSTVSCVTNTDALETVFCYNVTSALCSVTDTDALGTVFCYRYCYVKIVFCHRH